MSVTSEIIDWTPEARIIEATTHCLKQSKFVTSIFNQSIFSYFRDDTPLINFPVLSVFNGKDYSPDSYYRLERIIKINVYQPIKLIREKSTLAINQALATLRWQIQNPAFGNSVGLNMFDYDGAVNKYRNHPKELAIFTEAFKKHNPLVRYGIEWEANPATSELIVAKVDCYKSTISFKCWINLAAYYEMLESMGIDAWNDPNKIVYNIWENSSIDVKNLNSI